jgi:hypothetical protein
MFGLTERELAGSISEETFFDKLARDDLDAFRLPAESPDLLGYVERALRGGYPEPALGLSAKARAAWLAGSLEQLITRDAESVAGDRDPNDCGATSRCSR